VEVRHARRAELLEGAFGQRPRARARAADIGVQLHLGVARPGAGAGVDAELVTDPGERDAQRGGARRRRRAEI